MSTSLYNNRCLIREQEQTPQRFLDALRDQLIVRTFGGHFFVGGGVLRLTACTLCCCE